MQSGQRFECPICLDIFAGYEIDEHTGLHLDEAARVNSQSECPFCKATFPQAQLVDHVSSCAADESNESQLRSNQCPLCFADFPQEELVDHVTLCGAEQSSLSEMTSGQCTVCLANFPDDQLANHMASCSSSLSLATTTTTTPIINDFISGDLGGSPPARATLGLITTIASQLANAESSAVLCRKDTALITGGQSHLCGYRNFQMLLSSLSTHPVFSTHLNRPEMFPIMPSVARLQQMIQTAWREGFDVPGGEQLNFTLTTHNGNPKWIGTTEVAACLLSLDIRCRIIDVPSPSSSNAIIEFCESYFAGGEAISAGVMVSDLPPLYLQHQGHSQTIIGVETRNSGDKNLLVFDCAKAANGELHSRRLLKGELDRKTQWSMIAVDNVGYIDMRQRQAAKTLQSTRLPPS